MDILGIVGSYASILSLAAQVIEYLLALITVHLGNHRHRAVYEMNVTYRNGGTTAKHSVRIVNDDPESLHREIIRIEQLGLIHRSEKVTDNLRYGGIENGNGPMFNSIRSKHNITRPANLKVELEVSEEKVKPSDYAAE